jgi:tetratricopeptide (TPR) repeat protein
MFTVVLFTRSWSLATTWWQGRNFRLLFQGLPALVLAAAALVVATIVSLTPGQEVETRYLQKAKSAFRAKDYPAAMTCYDRLAHLSKDRPDILYGLARTAEAQGLEEWAGILMNDLAPLDRQGFAEAHLWWARRLLLGPNASPQTRKSAEVHLLRALEGELEDREQVHGLLGELYLNARQLDEAELHLQKGVKVKPQLRLRLAQLYALRGKPNRARSEAELAVSTFRAWAKADLYEQQARLNWADATLFLEDFAGAVAILQEGLSVTGDPVYRPALARVYVAWSDALARASKPDPGEQLARLEQALKYDPGQMDVLMRLWAFTKFQGAEADKSRAILRTQLAAGKGTGVAHLALGMDAWDQGKTVEALVHLEQAYQLAPQMGVVANNLAWVLASAQPPDLDRALTLMNSVLERWPNEPLFRDTRGAVLAKMGRWKEALTDLQAALPGYPKNPELHRRLAEAYEQLGAPEMAAEHRRLAEASNSKKEKSKAEEKAPY